MNPRFLIGLLSAAIAFAQRQAPFEGRPATIVENGKIELAVMNKGGAFVNFVLKDDAAKLSPMWNPIRASRELGEQGRFGDSLGHFVCVDGFGPTSKEEQEAGLQGHGEAHRQPWVLVAQEKGKVKFRARLPLLHETFTRQVQVVDGENIVYVESELENQLAFDRPINWAEHGTIGAPFLAPGKTVVDASVGRCETRPHNNMPPNRRLASEKEFSYPMAPLKTGAAVSIRNVPDPPNSMDHTGCLLDQSRPHAWVTAINLEHHLLVGYMFRREEYPWLQEWMNYPSGGNLARGLEFGTQPFDVSRRQTVEMGNLFGVPAFRWLPAKSKIGTRFLMFLTRVPDKLTKVDDVRLEGGMLTIQDKTSGASVRLAASLGL